jgi:hypothetical protein
MPTSRTLALMAACLTLPACQTITVNGHEVTRGDQVALTVGAVVAGGLILSVADKQAPPEASSPGTVECVIDIQTGLCR